MQIQYTTQYCSTTREAILQQPFIASIGFTSLCKRLITVACYWCSFLSNGHEHDQSKHSCLQQRHAKGIIHDIRMTKINRVLVWDFRLWQADRAQSESKSSHRSFQVKFKLGLSYVKSSPDLWLDLNDLTRWVIFSHPCQAVDGCFGWLPAAITNWPVHLSCVTCKGWLCSHVALWHTFLWNELFVRQ